MVGKNERQYDKQSGSPVIYLINGILKYNAYDGTLYLMDDSVDVLTLSRITNELLSLMVENNDFPLKRESILNELWSKRGLTSSSNNLNNYVSILRKALACCGFSEIISTIPRYGFMFSADVERLPGTYPAEEEKIADKLPVHKSGKQSRGAHRKSGDIFFLSQRINLITLVLLMLFVYTISHLSTAIRFFNNQHLMFDINRCRIYVYGNNQSVEGYVAYRSEMKYYVGKCSLNCEENADVFYFEDENKSSRDAQQAGGILGYCSYEDSTICINYPRYKRGR